MEKRFFLFALLGLLIGGSSLRAVEYPIDQLKLAYENAPNRLPPAELILDTRLPFTETEGVFEAFDGEGEPVMVALSDLPRGAVFSDGALKTILDAVVQYLNQADFYGVYVVTEQDQIDPRTGRDRREAGDTALTLNVFVGEIQGIQSVAKGGRIGVERPINHEHHSLILKHSPLKPLEPGEVPYLFRKEKLDDYLRRLNRHPGRRVDATVASGGEPGKIDLHYLVSENRPYFFYGQISNTGTESVGEWKVRAGVGHYQLTDNDDVFTFDYEVSDLSDSFSTLASYTLPLFYPDYLKLGVYASYSQFQGDELGSNNVTVLDFSGKSWTYGAELRSSPYQVLGFAHTYFAGMRGDEISVEQQIFLSGSLGAVSETLGEDRLYYLYGGMEFSRYGRYMNTLLAFTVEGNLNEVDPGQLDNLGRLDADPGWVLADWQIDHSFYLEPILRPGRFLDLESWESSTLANELSFLVRGQFVFSDDRIIPQQQFVMGGFRSVRGYPQSIAAADHGWFMQAEYRLHVPRLWKPYSAFPKEERPPPFRNRWNARPPRPLVTPDWDFIIRFFSDVGQTENVNAESFETDQDLWSAGVGIELQLGQSFTLRSDVGRVLKSLDEFDSSSGGRSPIDGSQEGDIGIHFQLTYVF